MTHPTNLNRGHTSEKKIIWIISKKPFDAHTDHIFKSLQILKFSEVYFFQVVKRTYETLWRLLVLTNNANGILKNLIRGMSMAECKMSPPPPPCFKTLRRHWKFMYSYKKKKACFLMFSKKCFSWPVKFIPIIPEIQILSTYFLHKQI